ncbi:EAL domain-containing protein [bacterium]|nr:EAL domain-containing protein [bacterium]
MVRKVDVDIEKRLILVVDDEYINREIMREILKDTYDIIFAENGKEAIDKIYEYKDTLSLVLLDLIMPVMKGFEVLKHFNESKKLKRKIPFIVITSDHKSEVESLDLGAVDFIPKPFPEANVISARIKRTIELFEDRETIKSTERDALTKLYAPEYFYRYATNLDKNLSIDMDALIIDIHHFHILNIRFGTEVGDEVLSSFSKKIKETIHKYNGIVSRRGADVFMAYLPHTDEYKEILSEIENIDVEEVKGRITVKIGVYPNVDKSIDIRRRYDRAKIACDTLRNKVVTSSVAYFNKDLYDKELFEEQLIDDFEKALEEKQFKVYFQPKFNVQGDKPVISSAEALLRWIHPTLGFISPGIFIPVFEKNGLIQRMDHYVWDETAKKIKEIKDKYGLSFPISVNVSRVNMFDNDLVNDFESIVKENGIKNEELLLEITESSYTENSEQIIDTVNDLRNHGFKIEMDDFGSGYSSLNMISILPIDVLKIDMALVRNAFSAEGNTRILELIMDIKKSLNVIAVAEGVETLEQVEALKKIGCDVIQGYYFSRPLNEKDFEEFLKKELNL